MRTCLFLPQLEVDGPSGFDAAVGSFKAKTGIGVDAIRPSVWSRISEKGQQLYTGLLNDVERTLTWPAQIQTLIYFLVRASVGTYAQAHSGSMDDSQDPSYDWACKGRSGRNDSMATPGAGRKGKTTNQV